LQLAPESSGTFWKVALLSQTHDRLEHRRVGRRLASSHEFGRMPGRLVVIVLVPACSRCSEKAFDATGQVTPPRS